jgi:hypothetical protein
MVLFAIVGELGSGKTLALSYLAWNNWYKKGKKVFANYNFYGFPFTPVRTLPDLDKMKEGFFAGDELWLWLDSRATKNQKSLMVSSILLKSRKRGITIAYTTQSIHQVEKRIRDVTDFIAYPLMSVDNSWCRLEIFRGPKPSISTRINPPIYFLCEPIFAIYNTYEEVHAISENNDDFKEVFYPIIANPAWIRYLSEKGIKNSDRVKRICENIEKQINPKGIKESALQKDMEIEQELEDE